MLKWELSFVPGLAGNDLVGKNASTFELWLFFVWWLDLLEDSRILFDADADCSVCFACNECGGESAREKYGEGLKHFSECLFFKEKCFKWFLFFNVCGCSIARESKLF